MQKAENIIFGPEYTKVRMNNYKHRIKRKSEKASS